MTLTARRTDAPNARMRAQLAPISSARFVNDDRAELLGRRGVRTVRDELLATPLRYLDFTSLRSVLEADVGSDVTVVVRIDAVRLKRPKPRLTVVEIDGYDATAALQVSYFGQPWMAKRIVPGQLVAFSGKMGFGYGYRRMSAPFYDVISTPDADGAHAAPASAPAAPARVLPVYSTPEGLAQGWARRIASAAVADYGAMADFWPAETRLRRGLPSLGRALRAIHFPHAMGDVELARRRLAYDEAVFLQLGLRLLKDARMPGLRPRRHVTDGPRMRALRAAMPFSLTQDQQDAVRDVLADMAADRSMSRLLLGDVGTGKTAVATVALGAVADTGTQAAVMAPTGVLALQYAQKVGPLLDAAGISWGLLTGATPARARREVMARLATGELTVLFGTHALLNEDVAFPALSLVVIDEQQRFGVRQRHALREKGRGADLLVMTATPIPRTLALSVYGDLDRSYLRQRPNPGAGVTTRVIAKKNRGDAYEAMRAAIEDGHQAYVVCPLIGAPEDADDDAGDRAAQAVASGGDPSDARAAEQEAEILSKKVFPGYRVGLLTGRMAPAEKQAVMDDFKAGRIQVLVSTTVIEVGVDVPNATVMLIEDGERFGLAQLHQLRGRVGRGAWPGTVFIAAAGGSQAARDRLGALERTTDGFELAEQDLRIRHAGELMGVRQSGEVTLRYVDLVRDGDVLQAARDDAIALLEASPRLEGVEARPIRDELTIRYGDVFREVSGG